MNSYLISGSLLTHKAVIQRFDQVVTLDRNQVDSFLVQSQAYDSPSPRISGLEVYDLGLDLELLNSPLSFLPAPEDPRQLYHAFATKFLNYSPRGRDLDASEVPEIIRQQLPDFLRNIPHRTEDDIKDDVAVLCGPPTMQAARLFVELGVYFASNNLDCWGGVGELSSWMIANIPWEVLRPMLSLNLYTIQAFTERFLISAIDLGRVGIVRDLLEIPRIITHVQYSNKALLKAINSSNDTIVTMLLHKGVDPNKTGRSVHSYDKDIRPLSLVKTVDLAGILVEAGADPNAIGFVGDHWFRQLGGPSLIMAVAQENIDLARYLIIVGASVNIVGTRAGGGFTALSMAVDLENLEMVQLLLENGADGSGVYIRRPLEYTHDPEESLYQSTSIEAAVRSGNLEIARLLLTCDPDLEALSSNVCDKIALKDAIRGGNTEIARLILDNGADINSNLDDGIQSNSCDEIDAVLLGQIELREAVLQNDLNSVKKLVDGGVQIDMSLIPGSFLCSPWTGYRSGRKHEAVKGTILHWAMGKRRQEHSAEREQSTDIIEFLVDKIQDLNAQNKNSTLQPILHTAIEAESLEIAEILIKGGADVNSMYIGKQGQHETPLILAANENRSDIVLFLLQHRANVNATVPAERLDVWDYDTFSYKYWPCYTTALQASLSERGGWQLRNKDQQKDVIQCLLRHGASINAPISSIKGRSELAFAVELNDMELVQQLLDCGAEINSPPAPKAGRTALQAAACLNTPNLAMIQLLLKKGALVNASAARWLGRMPLEAAAIQGHFQIVRVLLEAGADPNHQGSDDSPSWALKNAIRMGRLDIAYMLLEAGADPQNGGDSVTLAREYGYIAIAEMVEDWLRQHGAQGTSEKSQDMLKENRRVLEMK